MLCMRRPIGGLFLKHLLAIRLYRSIRTVLHCRELLLVDHVPVGFAHLFLKGATTR